jgi:hypothetical protein
MRHPPGSFRVGDIRTLSFPCDDESRMNRMGHYATMKAALTWRDSNAGPNLSGGFHVKRPSLGVIFLGLIPFLAICFSVSAWDRVYPMVLGLPFNLFWLLSWTVLTPICMWAGYRVEASRASKASERRHSARRS